MKIFAVCYYAPPKLTPQAIQIGRQLYHLDARVTLLHGDDELFADDFDQYPDFSQRVTSLCVRSPRPVLDDLVRRIARRVLPVYGSVPDGLGPWRRRAQRAARESIAAERPDVLVTFGMPMSDHLLGLSLKRVTGLPWLVHFSDPWADNPFHPVSAMARRVNRAMEKRVIGKADRVLFTSSLTLDMVMGKYPPAWRAKSAVLPHAWDMENVGTDDSPTGAPDVPDTRRVVRHIGAFYGARSPEPLFAALALLLERQPDALDGVRFEFVGRMHSSHVESDAYKVLPPGLVHVRGEVPYRDSLKLARDADALLVINAPSEGPSVFLPSKLVEYIGARRPVWGISPPGTAADLIAEWAGRDDACAAPDDIEGVARMLRAGVASLDGGTGWAMPAEVVQRFSPEHVAACLKQHAQLALEHSSHGRGDPSHGTSGHSTGL